MYLMYVKKLHTAVICLRGEKGFNDEEESENECDEDDDVETYSSSTGRRDVIVVFFISQFDAMSAGAGHPAQRTLTV